MRPLLTQQTLTIDTTLPVSILCLTKEESRTTPDCCLIRTKDGHQVCTRTISNFIVQDVALITRSAYTPSTHALYILGST